MRYGTSKFIQGIEVKHDFKAGLLTIKQTRYINDMVQRFNPQSAKAKVNP